MTGAVAIHLEEQGFNVIWHNDWQFSVGGIGKQWVICVVDGEQEQLEIEISPGMDNENILTVDSKYYEIADPSSFDKVVAFLRARGVEPCF